MKYVSMLLISVLLVYSASAQDRIYRKNGQVVTAKIIEIGSTDVKYRLAQSSEELVYVLEKDRISRIVFENGSVEKFTTDYKDPEQYTGQLKKAIKIDFFGPLLGYTQVTFEKSTGVARSYEISLGIIGAGKNQQLDYYYNSMQLEKKSPFGIYAAAGYKFNKLPNFLFGRTRLSHLMQGSYAKPVFYIGHYGENRLAYKGSNQYELEKQKITFAALQIELGKQWVFGDQFLIDMYWGLGYGIDNKKESGSNKIASTAYNYSNARLGNNLALSATFGLKVGLMIK